MGGSGGGDYFSGKTESLIKQLRQSEVRTRSAGFDASVNEYLSGLLVAYNKRDAEAINRHLGEIKRAFEKELSGTVDLGFGGSVAKHTYVDGISDIDSLVFLDDCELADANPSDVKDYFADQLIARFPRSEVTEGRLAVTIAFDDAEIQLLPAVSCENHVKIPNAEGDGWSKIRPEEFGRILSKTNEENGGKVVPVIKLAKALIATLPDQQQLSGYHVESLAVEAFKSYQGPKDPKSMLSHLFTESATRVLRPITDPTGQSRHVDDYLGVEDSGRRKSISDALSRITRKMRVADSSSSIDEWRALFGD
jgi:hypothetical protein